MLGAWPPRAVIKAVTCDMMCCAAASDGSSVAVCGEGYGMLGRIILYYDILCCIILYYVGMKVCGDMQ